MALNTLLHSAEAFVSRLTRPHPRITDAEIQYKARLLSGLLVVTVIVVMGIIALVLYYDPDDLLDKRTLTAFATVITALSLYIVNQHGYFHFAALAFVTFLSLIFPVVSYTGSYAEFMPFIVIPMLLAGMFYSWKQTTLLIITMVITIFVLNTAIADEDIWERRIISYFLLLAGGLIVVFKSHLIVLEAIRHKRIDEANAQREQHQLQLALEKERSETFRSLVGNIAHDIRTPLAIINTSLHIMGKHDDPAKKQEKLDSVYTQIRILENFTEDLVTMARLDSVPQLQLALVDVNKLVQDIEKNYRGLAEEKQMSLLVELDDRLAPILADHADLERALVNLVGNAINYTPADNSVTVCTRQQDREVVIEVIDTGIGISDADLTHIFDRFYRSAEAQTMSKKGSGLGLSIVKRIIEMHKGRVEVESVPGKGSTFRVRLPAQ